MSDQFKGSDFLSLDLRHAPSRGRAIWLGQVIRDAVISGTLAPGTPLPSSRRLAADLGVSRGTVVAAYQELIDSGWLVARTGSATVVTERRNAASGAQPRAIATRHACGLPWRPAAATARWDLTPGRPDLSFFPRTAWLRAQREALLELTGNDLGYPDPQGDPILRRELAGLLRRTRGLSVSDDDIIVTAGVSQATALIFELLRRRGATRLGVEDPGSRGLHDHVRHWGLEPSPIPLDAGGAVADALTDEHAVLLTPAHQFPTGVVLDPTRRLAILDWARATEALVIEDDYDAEHRYDRAPVSAMQGLHPGCVAYVGSVSKTLSPGLRLGWLVPPRHMLAELVTHKDASDRGTPVAPQRALAHLIRDGRLTRHLGQVRARQRRRRDALLQGLATHPHPAEIHGIAAGLHLMLALPQQLDDRHIAHQLADRGVLVDPLSVHRIRPGYPGLVIGYAAHTVDQLREAGSIISSILMV